MSKEVPKAMYHHIFFGIVYFLKLLLYLKRYCPNREKKKLTEQRENSRYGKQIFLLPPLFFTKGLYPSYILSGYKSLTARIF